MGGNHELNTYLKAIGSWIGNPRKKQNLRRLYIVQVRVSICVLGTAFYKITEGDKKLD